jgi:ABC-type transport system involved in multi-copper enzyme maturation permease subunit
MVTVISIPNILNVAHYERKTLLRSWFFRIFFIIAILIIVILDLAFFIIPVAAQWDLRAVPANLPLINILLLNVAQAVIAIFLASDFLKRDKKMDTAEVIYTRSISNNEYVLGKTWGTLSVFFGMTVFFLIITLVFNFIIPDTTVNWYAYLYYPLIISVPTLVFILGFAYILMILIKNQSVTFLILVGYVALTLFYLQDKYFSIFDYMAFNTPMTFSGITGFADFPMLIAHRLFYFFLGMAFIAATITGFNRLPNRVYGKSFYFILFMILLGVGGAAGGWYVMKSDAVIKNRKAYLALNNKYANSTYLKVTENDIDLIHSGDAITVNAKIKGLVNDLKINDTLTFTLNPGFKIKGITDNDGTPVSYIKEKQIIRIPLLKIPGNDTIIYNFIYSGSVNDAFCYLDISEEEFMKNRNVGPVKIDNKFSYISRDFVLLTPETFWYPVPGVSFNSVTLKTRTGYFSDYELNVKTSRRLKPVSQGDMVADGNDYRFTSTYPSKGLTLVIGKFDSVGVTVDSVDYNLFYKPGDDFFTYHLSNLKDTIGYIIQNEKSRYDNSNFLQSFSYHRLNFVEVPAHFMFFQRLLDNSFETTQPEIFLYPERGIGMQMADFKRFKRYESFRNRGQTVRPIDAEVNVFRRFLGNTFFTNSGIDLTNNSRRFGNSPVSFKGIDYTLNPYSFFPYYFSLVEGVNSKEYPLLETIFESYLRESDNFDFRGAMRGGMGEEEEANLLLQNKTVSDIISDPDKKSIIPVVIRQKGSFLLDGLKYSAGIDGFDGFLHDFLMDNRYRIFEIDSLKSRFQNIFGVDITPFLAQLGDKGDIPAFEFGKTFYIETRDDIGPVYLVKFKVTNISAVDGILDVDFRLGGGGFGGGSNQSEERIYLFGPNETKDIQIMLFDMPRMMMINTVLSKNIPASYNEFLRAPETNYKITPEEYAQTVTDSVSLYNENEFVVDNEDPGFSMEQQNTETRIKQYFDKLKNEEEPKYGSINPWHVPQVWRSVAHTAFNGSVIKSAYYTHEGNGERTVTWQKKLPDDGVYDVFVYIPRDAMLGRSDRGGDRGGGRRGGGQGGGPQFEDAGKEYQYFVYAGKEKEEIEFQLNNSTENGWNKLGSFFFPEGTAKIVLTNKTDARRVFADAVKWVKRN